MHDFRSPNSYPNSAPPSLEDLRVLIESRFSHLEGRFETGQIMISDAIRGAYSKADKCHERVTRLEEEVEDLRVRQTQSGPSPTGKPGLLASTTSLLKELRETMPKVSEMLLALGAVIAAVAMIWSPAPEPGLPRAPAPSSARSIAP